jgi:hypothetical protein
MKRLLALGAGTAGTMAVNKLRHKLKRSEWTITVVDQDHQHLYQPGLLLLQFGVYRRDELLKPRRLLPGPDRRRRRSPLGLPDVPRHDQRHRERPVRRRRRHHQRSRLHRQDRRHPAAVHPSLELRRLTPTSVYEVRQRPRSRGASERRIGATQVQRRASGTSPITVSTCLPQPDQVVLPQREQRAGEHIVESPSSASSVDRRASAALTSARWSGEGQEELLHRGDVQF